MNLDKCNWLNDAFNKINFNNLPHGIIINGPAGIGKKILAKAISEKIINNFAVDNNETITAPPWRRCKSRFAKWWRS